MLAGLLLTALLMGIGGMAHCAAMCGAPCAAVFPRGIPITALLGRCLGYAVLGLLASASAGLIARWGQQVSMLQPIWIMLQVAAVFLGIWMLWVGSMPQQVNAWGRQIYQRLRHRLTGPDASQNMKKWQPFIPLVAGFAWVAMPCGLLYAALMVAALAEQPWGGALVMLAFAVPSAVGVWAAPTLLGWLTRVSRRSVARPLAENVAVPVLWFKKGGADASSLTRVETSSPRGSLTFDPSWAVRLAGVSLAATAAWGVFHQIVAQWQAWCA